MMLPSVTMAVLLALNCCNGDLQQLATQWWIMEGAAGQSDKHHTEIQLCLVGLMSSKHKPSRNSSGKDLRDLRRASCNGVVRPARRVANNKHLSGKL